MSLILLKTPLQSYKSTIGGSVPSLGNLGIRAYLLGSAGDLGLVAQSLALALQLLVLLPRLPYPGLRLTRLRCRDSNGIV